MEFGTNSDYLCHIVTIRGQILSAIFSALAYIAQ